MKIWYDEVFRRPLSQKPKVIQQLNFKSKLCSEVLVESKVLVQIALPEVLLSFWNFWCTVDQIEEGNWEGEELVYESGVVHTPYESYLLNSYLIHEVGENKL